MGAQLRLKLERKRSYRRDDFILSPTNSEAIRTLDLWPNWHGGVLALVGPEGSGKTHLAREWADRVGAHILDLDHEEPFLGEGPMLLDDADHHGDDETLFHLINRAAQPGSSLLLTSLTLPASWIARLPDLKSRLNALPVAELGEPDDAILTGVLKKFFRERSILASDDLLAYLVRRIGRSVPEARRIVASLDEAADQSQRPITRALARELMEIEPDNEDLFDQL